MLCGPHRNVAYEYSNSPVMASLLVALDGSNGNLPHNCNIHGAQYHRTNLVEKQSERSRCHVVSSDHKVLAVQSNRRCVQELIINLDSTPIRHVLHCACARDLVGMFFLNLAHNSRRAGWNPNGKQHMQPLAVFSLSTNPQLYC